MKNLYLNLFRKCIFIIVSLVLLIILIAGLFNQKVNAQLINEPFNSGLNGWTVEIGATSDDVAWDTTNLAGGNNGEINVTGNSFSSITDRLISPPVNTTGMSSLTLTWNNYLHHYSSSYLYDVIVQTSTDAINWQNTSWITSPVAADIPVGQQSVIISNSNVGSATFYIAFTMTGFTFGVYHWYIDDVNLASNCINRIKYNVTGGGCNSGPVNLSGSQAGVNYQLYRDPSPFGSPIPGTGSAISFGVQTNDGTYTVRTVADATYCATLMNGSAIVTPTPTISSAATGSSCSGVAQNYDITSYVSSATFSWSRALVTGISNPAVTNQTSDPITEALINTTSAPINVTYVITPTANGCPGTPFNYVVTVNPNPVAPSVGAIVQPSCTVGTGSVTLNGLPASGNWTITRNPGGITTAGSGTSFQVTGLPANATYTFTVTNDAGCISPSTANVVINGSPVPPTPVITQNGNVLQSDAPAGNQWYNQASGLITGATNQSYTVTVNGYYYDIVTIAGCKSDTSNIIHITNIGIEDIEFSKRISVYPNPASDRLFVNFNQVNENPVSIQLFNSIGQQCFVSNELMNVKSSGINISNLNSGTYTLQITFEKAVVNKTFIINKP